MSSLDPLDRAFGGRQGEGQARSSADGSTQRLVCCKGRWDACDVKFLLSVADCPRRTAADLHHPCSWLGQGVSLKRIAIAILLALAALPVGATGMRTSLRVGAVVFRSCKVVLRPDVPL